MTEVQETLARLGAVQCPICGHVGKKRCKKSRLWMPKFQKYLIPCSRMCERLILQFNRLSFTGLR